jgi:hypothetical protein
VTGLSLCKYFGWSWAEYEATPEDVIEIAIEELQKIADE